MAFDNIKLPNYSFTVVDGYFFYFSHSNNMLVKKNSSGDTAFTYPIIDNFGKEAISTEYDGVNFWTLQEDTVSGNFIVKMWRIENELCWKKHEVAFNAVEDLHTYNLTSCSVEHFCTTLASGISEEDYKVYINKSLDYESYEDYEAIMTVGPNSDGVYETNTVSGVLCDGSVGLELHMLNSFDEGTNISFVTKLWMFDNYSALAGNGTLFSYNLLENYIDYYFVDSDITDIVASTFYETYDKKYIAFVRGTALKFFDIDEKRVDKSLILDNINSAGSTIYPIKDIEISDGTLYRIQNKTTYYGTDYSHSTYNYQCSPIRPFVDSITLGIYPKIIPSDGVSISELTIVVKDQYSEPSKFKTVYINDDDDEYGYITIPEILTGSDGSCLSYYRSGTSPKTVNIIAMVTQFD